MFPNYLILTPDGVGSTYLQRALTVYLNCAGIEYWNTHELLNGLRLENGNLYKDQSLNYTQSTSKICQLLLESKCNLVSRIANYHINTRLKHKQEDYGKLYNTCNLKFNKILYCTRDPFEYALSWSIRWNTKVLNVYSIAERIDVHSEDTKQTIDINYFYKKLQDYVSYEYWVNDNFNISQSVKYNELHRNVDQVLQEITGLDYSTSNYLGVSLQDFSLFRYKASLYKQTQDRKHLQGMNNHKVAGYLKVKRIAHDLISKKQLVNTIPVKMNTLQDKQNRITNFDDAVDMYNTWATGTNDHPQLTQQIIKNRILEEDIIYAA